MENHSTASGTGKPSEDLKSHQGDVKSQVLLECLKSHTLLRLFLKISKRPGAGWAKSRLCSKKNCWREQFLWKKNSSRPRALCAGATGRCHRAQHQVPYHTEEKYASESCHLQFDQPRAHNPEIASPILLLCHGVFTDQFILRHTVVHFFARKWNLRSVYECIRSTKTNLYFSANSGSPFIIQITTTDNHGRQWNSGQFSFEIWAWWIDAIVNDVEVHTG